MSHGCVGLLLLAGRSHSARVYTRVGHCKSPGRSIVARRPQRVGVAGTAMIQDADGKASPFRLCVLAPTLQHTAACSVIIFHGVPPPQLRRDRPSSAVVAASAAELFAQLCSLSLSVRLIGAWLPAVNFYPVRLSAMRVDTVRSPRCGRMRCHRMRSDQYSAAQCGAAQCGMC